MEFNEFIKILFMGLIGIVLCIISITLKQIKDKL